MSPATGDCNIYHSWLMKCVPIYRYTGISVCTLIYQGHFWWENEEKLRAKSWEDGRKTCGSRWKILQRCTRVVQVKPGFLSL